LSAEKYHISHCYDCSVEQYVEREIKIIVACGTTGFEAWCIQNGVGFCWLDGMLAAESSR